MPERRRMIVGIALLLTASLCALAAPRARTQDNSAPIDDREYWRLITELSEPGGTFAPQLMSNEDSAQFVLPTLTLTTRPGDVYLGVGSEQNFTYIAAVRPSLAFIVDIRRDNMLQMLMYQAVFELSADRAEFVSRLFSRSRPAGLTSDSTADAMFAAYAGAAPDSSLLEKSKETILEVLTRRHGFPLTDADRSAITTMLSAFSAAGPHGLKGFGDRDNATFAQLMTATDLTGRQRGFLASEDGYRYVRELARHNRIIPVVGDFAGDKALPGIARYLKASHAEVNVFYVSNVERYLFEQGAHGWQFYTNVAALPLDRSALFVRAVTRDISRRQGISVPEGSSKWWTFLAPIQECLNAVASGRIQTYRDLFSTRQ